MKKLFAIVALFLGALCLPAFAQVGQVATFTQNIASGGSPWTLTNTALISGGTSGGTSSSINTTGANLIIITVTYGSGSLTITDNEGNNSCYAANTLTPQLPSMTFSSVITYCISPTTGASHTFTISGPFSAAQITAWQGTPTPSFDQQSGAFAATGNSLSPGSLTPSVNNSLIISGAVSCCLTSSTPSVNSGMTIVNAMAYNSGVYFGYGGAYFLQGTSAPFNPTWSVANGTGIGVTMAVFKP